MSRAICVMQPRFLPYLGYFALVSRVDVFVIFDTAQFVRREWMQRNRIRAASERGWRYLGVPVRRAPRAARVGEVEIADPASWRDELFETLRHTYGRAPHYHEVLPLLEPLREAGTSLADLLVELLRRFTRYLGYAPEWRRASEVETDPLTREAWPAAERILALCRAFEAGVYWNLPGGRRLYDPEPFSAAGVELRFVPELPLDAFRERYPAAGHLSVLDLAMVYSAAEIRDMIELVFA